MAKIFPELEHIKNLKQTPTAGELHALEILKGLPNDYEVYFQPFINGYNPDIIIIRKKYGVSIIEVKSWKLEDFYIDNGDNWVSRKEDIPIKSPREQVKAYKDVLYNLSIPALLPGKLKENKYYGIVQTAVYFHNENSISLNQHLKNNDFCPVFGNDNFSVKNLKSHKSILRNSQNELFDEKIYLEFQKVLSPAFHTLEQEQGQGIKLSRKQEQLIKSEEKQQKIRGVAGSGKTLVLAQRAVNSHIRHGGKVLILTYNTGAPGH